MISEKSSQESKSPPQPERVKLCKFCGKAVHGDGAFCETCSKLIDSGIFCKNCGKALPPGCRCCPACGRSPKQADEKNPIRSMLISSTAGIYMISRTLLFSNLSQGVTSALLPAQDYGELSFFQNQVPFRFIADSPFEFNKAFRQWQIHYSGRDQARGHEIILCLPEDADSRRHLEFDSEKPHEHGARLIYRDGSGNDYEFGSGGLHHSRAAVSVDGWGKDGASGRLNGSITLQDGKPIHFDHGSFHAKIHQNPR